MMARSGIAVALHRTASRANRLLDRDAIDRIGRYVRQCQTEAGGFQGRGEGADLYYTLFGLASLRALRRGVVSRALARYLDSHAPEALDLVHLVSLLQCRRLLHPLGIPRRLRRAGAAALTRFQTPDHGYAEPKTACRATPYGLYLGLMGQEVLSQKPDDPAAMAGTACRLLARQINAACPDGDLNGLAACALVVQALCGRVDLDRVVGEVDGYRDAEGAYRAHAEAPSADLLSTAVAAFCLRFLGRPIRGGEAMKTAEYIQHMWDNSGGFRGHAADDAADCEYTFYALLAMGALEP